MRAGVYVGGREVAVLERVGDFRSVMTYLPGAEEGDLVSLTMPVRLESYLWDDQLPPIFQMNLPEGYLLQVLQEEFGPHVGADPLALLLVTGRNMVGRVQVAAAGADLNRPVQAVEVAGLLRGDNSEEAFAELVRAHAVSGVSGVLPKFLDSVVGAGDIGGQKKVSWLAGRHILKGSTRKLPYAALNEYLCMQVVSRVVPSAHTEVSDDGNLLVVDRFDLDDAGRRLWGMEDFCSLLGLRPAAKYETTWERIARAVRDHVAGGEQRRTFERLAAMVVLSHALRNADCHAKNIALLYTSRADAHLAPAYDFLTTSVYAGYQHNPPGISFLGKKTWAPGKMLARFLGTSFGVGQKAQTELVEQICDAVADVVPAVKARMEDLPGFRETGKRMLLAWKEGLEGLRSERMYGMGEMRGGEGFEGISAPAKLIGERRVVGKSPLLGER